jgi:RNA polymerase sigma-70 factor, ECF subfamily
VTQLHASEDDELVTRTRNGDLHAFATLMRRHNQRLYRAARAIVGTDEEAEDVLQEGYLRAFTALPRYRPGSFAGWMLAIVVNEARGRLRRRLTGDRVLEREGTSVEPPPGVDAVYASHHLRGVIEDALDRLSPQHRIVFVLRELEQMSTRETAVSLDLSETAVKTRLSRAKASLRVLLSDRIAEELADAYGFAGARCDRIVAGVLERLQRSHGLAH